MADEFEFYQDRKGEHRWRLKGANGKVIADSGEGYKTAAGARRGAEATKKRASQAKIPSSGFAATKPAAKKPAAKKPAAKKPAAKKPAAKKPASASRRSSAGRKR